MILLEATVDFSSAFIILMKKNINNVHTFDTRAFSVTGETFSYGGIPQRNAHFCN